MRIHSLTMGVLRNSWIALNPRRMKDENSTEISQFNLKFFSIWFS